MFVCGGEKTNILDKYYDLNDKLNIASQDWQTLRLFLFTSDDLENIYKNVMMKA